MPNSELKPWRVKADWGSDEEGTYTGLVWAVDKEGAEKACFQQMADAYDRGGEPEIDFYDVLICEPMHDYIRSTMVYIDQLEEFIEKGAPA